MSLDLGCEAYVLWKEHLMLLCFIFEKQEEESVLEIEISGSEA